MKKLLALLFVGCLSVNLVGMDNEKEDKPTIKKDQENKKDSIEENKKEGPSTKSQSSEEDDYVLENDEIHFTHDDWVDMRGSVKKIIMKNRANRWYRKAYMKEFKNSQIKDLIENTKIQEEATRRYNKERGWTGVGKDIGSALLTKTGAYCIDGAAQRTASVLFIPIDVLVIAPIATKVTELATKVTEWWNKEQIEQGQLVQSQQEYIKIIEKDSGSLFDRISKNNTLLGNLEKIMQEKGLDPAAQKKMAQELEVFGAEIEKDLAPDFIYRLQRGQLSQEEAQKVEAFKKKQEELAQKYLIKLDQEDLALVEVYNQSKEAMKNDICENLSLIREYNNLSKMNRDNARADVAYRKKAFMKRTQEKEEQEARKKKMRQEEEREQRKARLEREEKKKLMEEQWAQEKAEHELNKHNEAFLWNQQYGTQKWSDVQK